MRLIKLLVLSCLILFLGTAIITAQEVVPASGGNATGDGGSASYSVGQMVYTVYSGSNGSVAQGVQQPYEISVVTSTEEFADIILNISAYPNPAKDILVLSIGESDKENLSYQLFDQQGKIISDANILNNETSIDMKNLLPANYLLRVNYQGKEVKTFKIIKN